MTRCVYIASTEGLVGKSAIALGVIEALARQVESVGVFRPIVRRHEEDQILRALVSLPSSRQTYEEAVGVTYSEINRDPETAMSDIVAKYGALDGRFDVIVILGSDFLEGNPTEFTFNARIAQNLNAPIILVTRGSNKTPEQIHDSLASALFELKHHHTEVIALIATRVEESHLEEARAILSDFGIGVTAAMPEDEVLAAPTVAAQFAAAEATQVAGSRELAQKEGVGVLVASMTLPNVLDRLFPEVTVIAASDRLDLIPGLILAHESGTFPPLAGLVLVGGYEMPPSIKRLIDGLESDLPLATTELGSYTTAERLFNLEGTMTSSVRKIEIARRNFAHYVDDEALLQALNVSKSHIRTPLMFEYQLMQAARVNKRRIVLPEASDDRILHSADILLRRGVADLILLGDETKINARAAALGYDLRGAKVVDPTDKTLVKKFSEEYAKLRAHKGMTVEKAKTVLKDLSYFATMMVHLGMADGMVSGAVNTTANTIRPSLEFIKTKPGVSVVSSSFLMCMPDRVLVFGDCAVNPDPTAEQLADIAISSAETAVKFGVEPRVAMLSYSTGESGSGADVDKVRAATKLVRERAPHLAVEGPIQFDAAMDPTVAATKLPGSEVAGNATVFIFPDLNTGNNTYKAVQRTANAVAVGPVLQGLNKPVNDLSRGALVNDIVNTVAITAIQAQEK